MADRLPNFREIADALDELPSAVRAVRRARRMNLREVEQASGVSFNALSRLERGRDCSLANAKAVLRWLDEPIALVEEGSDG